MELDGDYRQQLWLLVVTSITTICFLVTAALFIFDVPGIRATFIGFVFAVVAGMVAFECERYYKSLRAFIEKVENTPLFP